MKTLNLCSYTAVVEKSYFWNIFQGWYNFKKQLVKKRLCKKAYCTTKVFVNEHTKWEKCGQIPKYF